MKKLIFGLTAFLLIVTACTNTDNIPGKLVVHVTDDPFRIGFIDSAYVTITKIDIRRAGEPREGNPFLVLSEDTFKIDLLHLRNGLTKEILNLEIPEGTYDLIRLYVDHAGLRIKDHPSSFHCKVPSGMQTGIKIFIRPSITIQGGLTSELLLDFDLSRSFVMRGNMHHQMGVTGFIFKPVIRAVNTSTAGRVEGFVTDASKVKITDAKVWLTQDSVVSTAFSDTLGYYAMIGIPAGKYSIHATKEDYDTVSVKDIKILAANRTVVNFSLTKK